MPFRVEGFAIISDDGMLADAHGVMPPDLVIEADQKFLSDGLDRASIVVHGRNSHENQPLSSQRKRLIATRTVAAIAPAPDYPQALWWNPRGASLDQAAEALGVKPGTAAILGGTELFGLMLPRYDVFHLSHAAGVRLPGGRPVFPQVPAINAEDLLAASGMTMVSRKPLDAARDVTLSIWVRRGVQA